MKIEILLIIIAFSNGNIYTTALDNYSKRTPISMIVLFIMYGLFGSLVMLGTIVIGVISRLYTYIMHLFQIHFWYKWHTKKYENLTENVLEQLNLKAKMFVGDKKNKKQTLNLTDRHYLYCFNLIRDKYNKTKEEGWTWPDNKENFYKNQS